MSRRLSVHSIPAIAGIVGPTLYFAGDITASLSTPNYNPIRDSISSLALTSVGWLQTIGFLVLGLLMEVFVAGLFFSIRRARGLHPGLGLLLLCGFGMMMIGAFRMDPVGLPHTIEGTVHSTTAYTLAFLFPVALLLLTPSLKSDQHWRGIYAYTLVSGILALALVGGLIWLPSLAGWFGLYERIMVANVTIWVAVAAANLMRLSLRGVPRHQQP
jgi:hypothetical protein